MTELDEMVESFDFLGDWDERYAYLIELGESLPELPGNLRTEANRVKACMSKVWVYAFIDEESPEIIRFGGDCDTGIIKGVLALLIKLASGRTAGEIARLDLDEVFDRLRLGDHLSPNRHVGVYAIVELMNKQAQQLSGDRRKVLKPAPPGLMEMGTKTG